LGRKNVQKAVLQWMTQLAHDRQFNQHTSQEAQGFQHYAAQVVTSYGLNWMTLKHTP